jgi:hypothetical protein
MKHLFTLFITCISIFCYSGITVAQENVKIEITKVQLNNKTVEFTVTSTKPFYVGGNIHILHIGKNDFKHSKQGKYTLTFLIPLADFNSLTEGTDVWLSYGKISVNNEVDKSTIENMCKQNSNVCWSLGKFSKQLTK